MYLILLLPLIGHIIFITFGLIFVNKRELKIKDDPKYNINTYIENGTLKPFKLKKPSFNSVENFEHGKEMPANVHLFHEGYWFYEDVIDKLRKATKSILIVSYIIKNGEVTREILNIIKQKAKEGLQIMWLIDDFGLMPNQRRVINKLKKYGVKIRIVGKIYYPFINGASFYNRNHQKFIIIDSTYVYSGGNNISDEYASLSKKYGHWIDLNYFVSGPHVNVYILHFIKLWNIIAHTDVDPMEFLNLEFNNKETYNEQALLVNDSPSLNYSTIEQHLIKLISNAKESILLSTPYFAVSKTFETTLILALKSGVKVTVYIPGLPDKKLVYKVTVNELRKLMDYGLEVMVYEGHFLHTKAGLIDGRIGWIGSNNLDARSFYSQYESMDLVSGSVIKDLQNIFTDYHNKCTNLRNIPELNKKHNWLGKFLIDCTKPLI
ncbi:phospholipase D-like domain-containing protein [Mycoplasma corogypsi]|uniref:phospholipase D-like domain-containing protein n=1 Tax=Mycoplasma corogypsi TaxID=2106 RepID=UPI003873BBF7